MARPKKYNIHLTEKELKTLKSIIRKKQTSTSQKRVLVHPRKRRPGIHSLHG